MIEGTYAHGTVRRLPTCEVDVYVPSESNPSGDEPCGDPAEYLITFAEGGQLYCCAPHAEDATDHLVDAQPEQPPTPGE